MFACILMVLIAWGNICATVVAPIAQVSVAASYRWSDPGYLYLGDKLVGCHNGIRYFGWDNGKWVIADSPVEVPQKYQKLTGVLPSKVEHNQCTVNGQKCDKGDGLNAMAKGSLTDDSQKSFITVYGDNAQGVVQDLQKSPLLQEFKDKYHVQTYPADHWAINGFARPTQGQPTIVVAWPNGKVVHRQSDYEGGSQALAEALRRVPNYDPNKDKDLRKSVTFSALLTWLQSKSPLGIAWWVVIATVLVIYYVNSKKGK